MLRTRLDTAARSAEKWLLTIDQQHLDPASLALHRLAQMLCRPDTRGRIVGLIARKRRRAAFDYCAMVAMNRDKLLRFLNSVALDPDRVPMDCRLLSETI